MQVRKITLLSFLAGTLALNLSAANMEYSNSEIYSKMCSKCHGLNGEGNPAKKGPSLNDMSAHELEISLFDLKSGGLNQSSGTEHDIMEHNMQKIIEKGMDYDVKSMSDYIFTSFNPDAAYFINDTATAEIYALALHDALPI